MYDDCNIVGRWNSSLLWRIENSTCTNCKAKLVFTINLFASFLSLSFHFCWSKGVHRARLQECSHSNGVTVAILSFIVDPKVYIEPDSWNALIPMVFSSLGLVVTSLMIWVFIRHNNTPVVKASGRELSYVLLSGVFLSYAMTFIFVLKVRVPQLHHDV